MRSRCLVVSRLPVVGSGGHLTATALSAFSPPDWPQTGSTPGSHHGARHAGAQRRTDPFDTAAVRQGCRVAPVKTSDYADRNNGSQNGSGGTPATTDRSGPTD